MDQAQQQQLKKAFAGKEQSSLTPNELKDELKKNPMSPLEAILFAEQEKELRLNDARKTLNVNGKTKKQIQARYPESPFDSN
jgi:hypothetical protein